MTLQQLHFFAEVANRGSINQAAKKLFVAQSNISNAIRDLESELGITIFFRHNKGMRLTREGQVLYNQVKIILDQENRIKGHFSTNTKEPPILITISSLHFSFASKALVRLIHSLEDSQYEIRFKENNIQYTIDDVESGQSDIGLIFLSATTEDYVGKILTERNLTFHKLATTVPHAFMRKGHPLANRTELSANEFEDYPYVVLDLEYTAGYKGDMLIKGFVKPKKVLHLSDRATHNNVVRFTDAYSIGTGCLPKDFSDNELVSIPITRPLDALQIGYIHPARKKLSPFIEAFVAQLGKELEEWDRSKI